MVRLRGSEKLGVPIFGRAVILPAFVAIVFAVVSALAGHIPGKHQSPTWRRSPVPAVRGGAEARPPPAGDG